MQHLMNLKNQNLFISKASEGHRHDNTNRHFRLSYWKCL